jgi:spore coat protein CotH
MNNDQHHDVRPRGRKGRSSLSLGILILCVPGVLCGVSARIAAQRPLLGVSLPADAFFDDTRLHDVRLTLNARDWQTLKDDFLGNTYYPTDFRWRDQVVRNVGIRSRGTGSRSGTKPGLRVDFDRYINDMRFLGLKSFVLRNNVQDASNLHERLSMLLFRRMGLPASRQAHARLFVNNDYVGLYTLVESVDKGFLQRAYNQDNGYLYDYDYPVGAPAYYFEDRGVDPASYVPLPFKPETHEDNPRPEFIVELIQTINLTTSPVFRTAISEYVDLDQFLKHVAVEMFVAETDGFLGDFGANNFFLHRFDNTKRFSFIPWDKSEAFKGGINFGILHNIIDVPSPVQNRLMARTISQPDNLNFYLDQLLECVRLAGELDGTTGRGWLEQEIEREYQQIRTAALEDPVKPYTNQQFEQEIDALRAFARERGARVTEQVAAARPVAGIRAVR